MKRAERQRLGPRKKRVQTTRRWIAFRLGMLAYRAIRSLPLGLAGAIGETCGRLLGLVARPLRVDALHHLEIALGDRLESRERRRVVRRLFAHLGRSAFEYLVYTRLGRARVVRSVVAFEGREHLEAVAAGGRGALCVTPHYGLWEILPVFVLRQFPGCVVGVRLRFDPADRLVSAMREGLGVETVHQSRAREILRRLRRGDLVGILPDQDANHLAGTFLPFFGREAFTLTGPATLAWTARCPVVPLCVRRVGPLEHRVEVFPALEVPRDRPRDDWIRDMTLEISRAMERIIEAEPSQWVWFHRRWKTTPENLERRRERRARRQAEATRRRLEGDPAR